MKKVLLYLILLNITIIAQGFLKTEGSKIVDPEGNGVVLIGLNLGNWLVPEGYMFQFKEVNSPRKIYDVISEIIGPYEAKEFFIKFQDSFITEGDVKFIKDNGFNTIRIPFNYRMYCEEDYLGNTKNRGFELIDRVVNWAEKYNLYVVLDMHCAPGGQTGDNIDDSYGFPWLMTDEQAQDLFVDVWVKIAEYYKNEPTVVALELINEPIAHYFENDDLNKYLEPLYKRTVKAIRKVNRNHIIILGGARWNTDFTVFSEPFDDNLIYAFHKYWMPTVQEEIQVFVDFRKKYNVPIWMSESGENDDEWINGFRKLLDKNNIGWAFWPFKKIENTRGPLQYDKPEYYDLVTGYVTSDRSSYKKQRENMPDRKKAKKALNDLLDKCRFENCTMNKGFMKALGVEIE